VQAAGVPGQEHLRSLPLYELDRADSHADHLTSLYIPAQTPLAALRLPQTLAHITARLRAPAGCPWDREQTHRSLLPHVIEETYEVVEAIERDDPAALSEELGDLLLQVVLHAQLAEEEGVFVLEDVVESICAKLIRRHPHVFGEVSVTGSAEVLRNWDQIKAAERQAKGMEETTTEALFAGIPRSLPALSRAQTVQRRAGRAGYVAPEPATLLDTLATAAQAALAAADTDDRRVHLGTALFAAVDLARHLGLDAEETLRLATDAFSRRA
jgi:tetrapyrrole methylase family protein/MazG family protein